MRVKAGHLLRAAAFVGAHAVAIALVYKAMFEPALDLLEHQRARLEASAAKLDRARAAATRNRALADLSPEEIDGLASRFIQGEGPAVQGADLLARLRTAAQEHDLSFSSVTFLQPLERFGRSLAGARVELVGPADRTARWLESVESGPSLLLVRRARIDARRGEDRNMVAASIEIYGVVR